MKSFPIGELKSNFSNVMGFVQEGKRQIGILKGKSKVRFGKNFKMTEKELLELL